MTRVIARDPIVINDGAAATDRLLAGDVIADLPVTAPWAGAMPAVLRHKLDRGIAVPQDFGAVADYYLTDGTVNPSPTDNYAALQAMLDAGRAVELVPAEDRRRTGFFLSAPLKLYTGAHIFAHCSPGSTQYLRDGAVALVSTNGDTILDLRTNNAQHTQLKGFILYGVDKTTHGIDKTPLRTTLTDMQVLYCNSGIGGVSGQYGEHSNYYNLFVAYCAVGIQRIRDTRIIGGRVASCDGNGISLSGGANNNRVSCKVDWNGGWGVSISDCDGIYIDGEGFDRNGKGAVRINDSHRVEVNALLWRNGRADSGTAGEDTSIYIGGTSHNVSVNVATTTGVDDGGSGTETPRYALTLDGTDLYGIDVTDTGAACTVAPVRLMNGATLDKVNLRMHGLRPRTVMPSRAPSRSTGNLSNGGSASLTFDLDTLDDYERSVLRLTLTARRSDTIANTPVASYNLALRRDIGSASIDISGAFGVIKSGDTFFANTATPSAGAVGYQMSISADGKTLTITIVSAYSAGTVNVKASLG